MSEDRFDVIEKKIDRLAEAIMRLAVVDERLTNLITINNRTAERLAINEADVGTLKVEQATQQILIYRIEKLLWLVGAGLFTALWKAFFGG